MQKPRYIDIHSHGSFGINFNNGSYDEIKKLLKNLYNLNVKGICPTLVGDSNSKIQKQLEVFSSIRNEQLKNKSLNETLILGIHLEGSFLSPNKSGIQDKSVFLKPTMKNFLNLVGKYENVIKIVTIAPEEDIDLIDYLNSKQIKTHAGHTTGENIKNCTGVTHTFNAMNQMHHRNETVLLDALVDDSKYCEFIADLIHTNVKILKLLFKVKPIDKILIISDSLPSSNYNSDIIFCGKKINKFGKDDNGTLAGSNKTINEICQNLINNKILNEEQIEKTAFLNQIDYLKLSKDEIDILNN